MRHGFRAICVHSCLFVLLLLAPPVRGTEVVVKNDSASDGSTVAIQAGFWGGESAAAWLTSPCDGNIVAVQVFWLSKNGGAPDSIEDSITIFEAGTFPVPGAVLAYLEAPNMQDGGLNEFRYLDENNTMPLSVPVTTGQRFVVSFKFYNTPNPTNGPSVVTDTNGCQAGKNGLDEYFAGWSNACSYGIGGDFVIRAVVNCGALPGACCLPSGACEMKTAGQCAAVGGTYKGDGVSCAGVSCPPAVGACCFSATACLNLTQSDCATAQGSWLGPGTACNGTNCPTGACCLPNGSCTGGVTPTDCQSLGGVFQGTGTSCGSVQCPQPSGACCLSNGACLSLLESDCHVIPNASWAGPGTTCANLNGNSTADVCERHPADLNCDGAVNNLDIDHFVLALIYPDQYVQRHPTCNILNGDINGDGATNNLDIDGFVVCLLNFGCTP